MAMADQGIDEFEDSFLRVVFSSTQTASYETKVVHVEASRASDGQGEEEI